MKIAFQFFKKYPISIISYLLYGWLCFELVKLKWVFHDRLKHLKPYESSLSVRGEGVGYGTLFLLIAGTIFLSVIILNAAFRKGGNRFYWWLSLLIVIQTFVVLYM
jgi:hypothetical protein